MSPATQLRELDGAARAAAVLLTLGPELAGKLLESFSPSELQAVSARLQQVQTLSREQLCEIFAEFRTITENKTRVSFDTDEFMRSMLNKFSAAEQGGPAGRMLPALEVLSSMSTEMLHAKLQDEHPQVIATLLSMLPSDTSAQLIEEFDPELRDELLLRVAFLDRVDPQALSELNDVLERSLQPEAAAQSMSGIGGSRVVADILDNLSMEQNKHLLAKLNEHDPKLAAQVSSRLFSFDSFAEIDPAQLQRIIPEVPSETLAYALKGASDALRELFVANMTARMSERLQLEISGLPPVRISEVESRQREIVSIARRLEDQKKVSLERVRSGSRA